MGWEAVDWFDLPQDKDQWWPLVNMAKGVRVS